MSHKLIRSIFLLLLLVMAANGQTRRESRSLRERAQALEPFIVESAKRHGIDPRILRSVCFVESRFRTDAVSPKGARGPMQFIPETAIRYGLTNPHDPKAAIDAAARYLRDLLKKFSGRVDLAVAAYNAGEGAVDSFRTGKPLVLRTGKVINSRGLVTGGIPPYRETQTYVNQIMGLLARPYPRSAQASSRKTAEKTSPRIKTRDFTLDVLSSNERTSIQRTQQMNSFFIEIDGPH
jgi:soluble lytic murein transglycosylase-like protein